MKECILCKRNMFLEKGNIGQGCIKNIYSFLNFKMPKRLKLRENELYDNIMKTTNKRNLNKEHKLILADRYLTLKYMESMKYGDFDKLKSQVKNDIEIIDNKVDINGLNSTKKISLKSIYDLYKKQNKFEEIINKLKNVKSIDVVPALLASFSFIFNMSNNKTQYELNSFKMMQYAFWQTVIEVGRTYFGFKYAADFLQHSLEKSPKDLVITEGNLVDDIKKDKNFKNVIIKIVEKYGKNQDNFQFDSIIDGEIPLIFEEGDLYYAINKLSMRINAIKINNSWNLKVKMHDRYDYSENKKLGEYFENVKDLKKSIFSTTLYKLAHESVNSGVIKEYDIDIEFNYIF